MSEDNTENKDIAEVGQNGDEGEVSIQETYPPELRMFGSGFARKVVESVKGNQEGFISIFLNDAAKGPEKKQESYWVEKTPGGIPAFDAIIRSFQVMPEKYTVMIPSILKHAGVPAERVDQYLSDLEETRPDLTPEITIAKQKLDLTKSRIS